MHDRPLATGCATQTDDTDEGSDALAGDLLASRCDGIPGGKCPPPPPPPPPPSETDCEDCEHSGFARAVDIRLLEDLRIPFFDHKLQALKILNKGGIHIPLSDASIGPDGGHAQADLLDLEIPDLLAAQVLHAEVTGSDCQTRANAELANVEVGLHNLKLLNKTPLEKVTKILADLGLDSGHPRRRPQRDRHGVRDKKAKPVLSANTEVVKLRIGNRVLEVVPGEVNQTFDLLGPGFGNGIHIAINEQFKESKGNAGKIRVNALHVNVLGIADVVVSAAEAGIVCK